MSCVYSLLDCVLCHRCNLTVSLSVSPLIGSGEAGRGAGGGGGGGGGGAKGGGTGVGGAVKKGDSVSLYLFNIIDIWT